MESVLLVAPITALEFVGDHLLAGEGPNLTVYSLKANGANPPRIQQTVLGGYTIHGIKPTPTSCRAEDVCQLCVFGSKGLVILKFNIADQQVHLSEVCSLRRLHDWIWDAQWLHEGPQAAAYLGLALGHNSVALYDFRSGRVLKEVHCAEKCILYSAHFVGRTWEELTLISGTVFNQLVIWGMCDQTDQEGRVEPRRRISGHNGVIFSIFYMKGMLASASDDRSLRVWKVGDLADSESDVQCLLVLYGHQSRVWSVRLLQENIVSIGEDSACIVWSYAGDIVHNFKGHKGRGIRAVAVQDQLGWVATGGADSGIRLWQIKGRSSSSNGLVNLHFNAPERTGAPKAIAMIDTNCLVVMTDVGSIYMNDLLSKQWTFVLADENYRSYSLLDVFKSSTNVLCAIGNIAGGVKIFSVPHDGHCPELRLYDGKVHNLTWVPSPCLAPDRCHLFSSGPNGVTVWLEVTCVSGHVKSISEKCRFSMPACKQRWHTSIAFVPTENVIVCGDRRGSLMLFSVKVAGICHGEHAMTTSLPSDCPPSTGSSVDSVALEGSLLPTVSNPPEQIEDPVFVLYGIHGKLGVTSVIYHDGFVYSAGRDGLYRQLKVEGGQLIVLRKLKSCKGMEWIERLSFMPDGSLQILGFHSTDFVVWSTKTNEKLYCVPCGGGHRSWSYKKEGPGEVFAYIKSGDILAYQSQPAEKVQSVLKEPLHGRELTCVKYAGNVKLKESRVHVLITSSEDTTVSVLGFNEVSKEIWQLSTISDHLSSVRTLALAKTKSQPLENGVLSCVLFTAGGRAQIECYRLLVQAQEDVGCVTCQVIHLASHRLDEHWDRMKNKHRRIKVDPETRYMSIRALEDAALGPSSACLFLAAACSDGSVRFFMMCEDLRRMILVAETFYHQRCVLKVEAFVHRSADSHRVWLCSASTDGRIAFWDITSTVECAQKMLDGEYTDDQPQDLGSARSTLSVHQSGINSLHIRKTTEGDYLLASGGDDNSIHICKLDADGQSQDGQTGCVRLLQSFSVTSAHAAHVTGLRILRQDLLASASVDQRLTLWNLGSDGLQHLATRFCHVADVSELDCWQSEDGGHWCVQCGQGLEIVVYKHSTFL
ncbi:PREDICTED: WD repeat-containing protein 6 [Nanorana parkeri]|uniref:WD repeat-containing protein 6 n=1 Tax=Nanorana parkeri TaxID=125878 RepID=UPI00085480E2|nr:PREDICTED: WD repeat-containing protein 6 [Nanorana parkeri]